MFEAIVNFLGEKLRNFYPDLDYSDESIRKIKSKKVIPLPRQIKIGVFE